MHPVLAASEAVSPGLAWLETRISSLVDKFWTTSRLDPKTNVQDARMRTQQSKDEVNRIQRQLDGLNQVSSAIEELEEKQLAAEAAVKVLEQELQQTRGLAADWEAYKRNQAECQTLEHEQTVLVGWLTRWERAREQHKSLLQQTSEFGRNQELAFSEMGPEPNRRLVEALSARLNYAQALLQQKRRGELDELRAPGTDDLASLAALKQELALAVEALERLSKLESLAKEQQELEVRLQSNQSKVEQQSQSLNVLQAEFEAQEGSGMAERQALKIIGAGPMRSSPNGPSFEASFRSLCGSERLSSQTKGLSPANGRGEDKISRQSRNCNRVSLMRSFAIVSYWVKNWLDSMPLSLSS